MDFPAFEAFFHWCQEEQAAYALTLVGDAGDTADICQQAFLKLWQHRRKVDIANAGRAYLYKTVYHQSLDLRKHREVPPLNWRNTTL